MKRLFYLLCFLCSFSMISCEDEFSCQEQVREGEHLVQMMLSGTNPQLIVSRAQTSENLDESIENAILFIFDKQGHLYKKVFQQFDNGNMAVINMYLSNGLYEAYAICNALEPEQIYKSISTLDELQHCALVLNHANEAYRGKYMFSGKSPLTVNDKTDSLIIGVSRLVALHDIMIHFKPDNEHDDLLITKVKLHSLPKGTWMFERTEGEVETNSSFNDWIYKSEPSEMADCYFKEQELKLNKVEGEADVRWSLNTKFHSLENRRGGVVTEGVPPYDYHSIYWPNSKSYAEKKMLGELKVCRQIQKARLGKCLTTDGTLYEMKDVIPSTKRLQFANATYLTIEGVYRRSTGTTWNVVYTIFLGSDNYKDFNIRRNTQYHTIITIQSFERLDTRVQAEPVGNMVFSTTQKILDSHCCAERVVIAAQDDWKAWVVNPDRTPWLELSKSPVYDHRRIGDPDNQLFASYSIYGAGGLSYAYIHVDEFLPSLKNPMDNNRYAMREGTIAYQMKGKNVQYVKVRQFPAQMGILHIKFDVHDRKEICDTFYLERCLEEKHLSWGLEEYWSFTTDDLIAAGRWNGLSNTRRLFDVATKGDKWGVKPAYSDGVVPSNTALGYVVNKNRDRDGNGKIETDEILWYWPSVKELQCLREALNKGYINFDNSDDIFHSSTPSSADPDGITTGYSYSVKMSSGKMAVTPRNRLYNVICMRRKNSEWHGPLGDDAHFKVIVETGWKDEEIVLPIN